MSLADRHPEANRSLRADAEDRIGSVRPAPPSASSERPSPAERKRQVAAWAQYGAAAHGWQAPVAAVLSGPWLLSLATNAVGKHGLLIVVGPFHLRAEAYPSAMLTVASIFQLLLLPILGAAADARSAKRRWLQFGCITGSVVCALLALTGGSLWLLAGLLFLGGSALSSVTDLIWNGMLPELAEPDGSDIVSSHGAAIGYLGAGVILALELAFLNSRGLFGLSKATAVRLCFLVAAIWWASIGLTAIRRLNPPRRTPIAGAARTGRARGPFAQLGIGYRLLRQMPQTRRFVLAYICFGDAVSSVISLASTFLTHELFDDNASKASTFLFALILMVQFVAIAGALLFRRVARRIGTKRAILVNLVVWFGVIAFAYAVLDSKAEAVLMGAVLALALGGSTALARSLFSRMIPAGLEATFFALFEVSSAGTSWLAPLIFTIVVNATGSYRQGILALMILFIAGFVLLCWADTAEAEREAAASALTPKVQTGTVEVD